MPPSTLLFAELAVNYSITTTNFGNVLDFVLSKDSVRPREREFIITNRAREPITIDLVCDTTLLNETELTEEELRTDIDICDFVFFENKTLILSPNELEPTEGKMIVFTPPNVSYGDKFLYNVLATRAIGNQIETFSKLSVSNRAPVWAVILKWSPFPGQEDEPIEEKSAFPVFWVAFGVSLIAFFVIIFAFRFFKKKGEIFPLAGFLIAMFSMLGIWGILTFAL